ncbi:hypothetical protein [Ralstonia solanacearum]
MSLRMFPAKIENLRRNPVCLQRYRHVVARKRQHGLTTTLIYATTPRKIGDVVVDVLECGYRPHSGDPRSQQQSLCPGISVGNLATGETGTLGALVHAFDGTPYILSNWHVLAGGADAKQGDQIIQPGPMHLGPNTPHLVATLDRSLSPYEQLDAALGRVAAGVPLNPQFFDLDFFAASVAEPSPGTHLVKSGAVSGVTEAMVDGIGGVYQLDYSNFGLPSLWMRGFRLVKDSGSTAVSISEPGDSGAVWVDPQSRAAVGLHFGGEDDASSLNDYALAHPIGDVLRRLSVNLIVLPQG